MRTSTIFLPAFRALKLSLFLALTHGDETEVPLAPSGYGIDVVRLMRCDVPC